MVVSEWIIRWQSLSRALTLLPHTASYTKFTHELASLDKPASLAFANANAFNIAVHNAEFYNDLIDSTFVMRDGIGVSILLKMLFKEPGLNLNGTDFIPVLVDMFAQHKQVFYGTTSDVVLQAAVFANTRGAQDVHVLDGFQPEDVYLEHAQKNAPRLIVLGMGMPRQERIAKQLRDLLEYPVLIVSGGAILDFMGGKVQRAPEFIRLHGFEWAYRFALEPKRLFKRYIIGNPQFMVRAFWLAAYNKRWHKAHPPQLTVLTQSIAAPANSTMVPLQPSTDKIVSGFQANRPVITPDELFGRATELNRLHNCIIENQGHMLIYGQRGYGKTSLARVFGGMADEAGQNIFYISCARNLTFPDLVALLMNDIVSIMPTNNGLLHKIDSWRQSLPTIFEIAEIMGSLDTDPVIFILDEYDRIACSNTRESLIELIKSLSDIAANVKFLLVGVASDATQILGYHPSIHRCLTCMPLYRLTPDTLETYITDKIKPLNLSLSLKAISKIVHVCAGSSYHVQLIGQLLMEYNKDRPDETIDLAQLIQILQQIVRDAVLMDPSLIILTEYYAGSLVKAKQLMMLVDSALAHNDVICGLHLSKAKAPRALCEDMFLQNAMEASAIAPNGKVRDFRFSNGFAPQILRMVDFIAQEKNGSVN